MHNNAWILACCRSDWSEVEELSSPMFTGGVGRVKVAADVLMMIAYTMLGVVLMVIKAI